MTGDHISQSFAFASSTAPQDLGREEAASFDVYKQIRDDIVKGKLKPDERLRFEALRTAYPAGIGTLREALSHLVSDGLVRTEVGRGFRVAPVSAADLNDITEWRVLFEVRAVVQSIRNGDESWEAEIVSAFHILTRTGLPAYDAKAEEWEAYGEKHRRFHEALVARCGSPWLLHFRSVLFAQARRYQALAIVRREPLACRTDDDHRAIMEAVLAGDEKRAAELIESHIRLTASVVREELSKSGHEHAAGSASDSKAPRRRGRKSSASPG